MLLFSPFGGRGNFESDTPFSTLESEARRLCHETLLLDTHIDVPYRLYERWEDVSRRTRTGEFDLERAREGGLNAAFLAIYVPASFVNPKAFEFAGNLIGMVEDIAADHPELCIIGRTADDIETGFHDGRMVWVLGLENGSPIGQDVRVLSDFYARGIRYITLTHAANNQICDSSFDSTRRWHGLSPFGRRAVQEMNRLGMMVDVSHVSDETFYEVLDISRSPVIASHSSCRSFTPGWERNLNDDMIRALAEQGGVVQVNFGSMFISGTYQRACEVLFARLEQKGVTLGSPEAWAIRETWRKEFPLPQVTVSDVVDHIDHIVELAGIDHVGFGSDFDGVDGHLPEGLEDVSKYPALIGELLRRGYSKSDIQQICAKNFLRVWRTVDDFGGRTGNG